MAISYNAAAPQPKENMGQPEPRLDATAKVTGAAQFAADFPAAEPAHAFLVTSSIAKGRVTGFDLAAAKAVRGVLDIVTHENAEPVKELTFFGKGGPASTEVRPLSDAKIWHDGQIVALVLAETYEAAREAAYKVRVSYQKEEPTATLSDSGTEIKTALEVDPEHKDPKGGDAEAAFAAADVKIEARYHTPPQHHNSMELYSTTCSWAGDMLTVHEPSQWVYGLKHGLAIQLGIAPDSVRIISPYVGGAFGSKAGVTPRTVLIAQAARRLKRPVKLVMTREQGFTNATFRAETRHDIRLAAKRDGTLTAYTHDAWELTSRSDWYFTGGVENTVCMYNFPNVATKVSMAAADRNTPGFMRAPAEVPYMFALETAMDELAVALAMDPVELRRVNDTMAHPLTKAPFTSRSLMKCYDEAGAAFGWSKRDPKPGSMRDGDWLIGWGCATATYPTQLNPAATRVRLTPQGKVKVEVAAHDVGTGAYTVIGQMAAERLGVPLKQVEVELGDSKLPPGPVAGGSVTTASVCSAVAMACDKIRDKLGQALNNGDKSNSVTLADGKVVNVNGESMDVAQAFEKLKIGVVEEYAEFVPEGGKPGALKGLYEGKVGIIGGPMDDKLMFAFGAEFVEVRINARTREIRAPRIVGAFAAGRIMNTRTARSQYLGGMIWGIGSALHEGTEIDVREARYVNDNIAEYLIPVNADVDKVEIIMVPEVDDAVNPSGIKGIGELSNVGTAAAISNAVFHATGKRIRHLPIRIEDVI